MVIFDLSRDARMIQIEKPSRESTSHASSWEFGWYPDGRAFWYRVGREFKEGDEGYFRVFIGSWQKERLSAREAKRISVDWDLLGPRFWYPGIPDHRLHRPKWFQKGIMFTW